MDVMMNKKIIVFHAKAVSPYRPCMDGLFAAAAAAIAIPEARLVPAAYGKPPELGLKQGDLVHLLDLTYPYFVIEEWAKTAQVTILDHHKGAMQDLMHLSAHISREFDMSRSGAVISWQHFHRNEVPLILQYVQDRDLWTKQLPGCDLVSLALSELMRDKTVLQCVQKAIEIVNANDLVVEDLKVQGASLEAEMKAAIAGAVAKSKTRLVIGYEVPFYKCRTPREFQGYSDIGNALLSAYPAAPFAVVQVGDGWALRSKDDRLDVQEIAKSLGGGGHRNASGCRAELRWFVW
jgi:uncharacterized protein